MRLLFWLFLIAATWVGACSTISTRQTLSAYPVPSLRFDGPSEKDPVAADAWLEKKYREQPTEPMRLLIRYRQAALWAPTQPAKACGLFKEIASQSLFPARDVARVRALETCPSPPGSASDDVAQAIDAVKQPWLREFTLRAALSRAEKSGDHAWEMKLSADIASSEKLQRDRVRRLERAIQLSKEFGDAGSTDDFTRRLQEFAPRFIPDPPQAQWLSVATDFRQAREFDKAREFFSKVISAPDSADLDRLRAYDGIRLSYKLQKKTDEYIKATKDYAKFARERFFEIPKKDRTHANSPEVKAALGRYVETQLAMARAVWTEDGRKEAEALLLKLEKDLKGLSPVDESVFIRARMDDETGNYAGALAKIEKIQLIKIADRGLRQKILWYKAWYQRRLKHHHDAVATFERLLSEDDSQTAIARDHFWLARTLRDAGDADKANEHLEWLAANDPMGYYGLLAYRELKRPLPVLPAVPPREPASNVNPPAPTAANYQTMALTPEDEQMAQWLIAVGENDLARRFIDFASSGQRASLDQPRALDLLQLYARTGHYQTLFLRLTELSSDTRQKIINENIDLVFPRPWLDLVTESSQKHDVPAELIYAIMRQESSFNPLARSPADAYGLMQMIPEMAKVASSKAKVEYMNPDDLYRPEINIPLGAAFLRGLLNTHKDSFILTTASYNASERAIRNWLKTRFRGDVLEFIEDIPYDETRVYVKLVMRNYVFYSRMKTQEPLDFPEWCFKGLGTVNESDAQANATEPHASQ